MFASWAMDIGSCNWIIVNPVLVDMMSVVSCLTALVL